MISVLILAAGLSGTATAQEAETGGQTVIEARGTYVATVTADRGSAFFNLRLPDRDAPEAVRQRAQAALEAGDRQLTSLTVRPGYDEQAETFWSIFFPSFDPDAPATYFNVRSSGQFEAIDALEVWAQSEGEVTNSYRSAHSGTPGPGDLIEAREGAQAAARAEAEQLAASLGCVLGVQIEQRLRQAPPNTGGFVRTEAMGDIHVVTRQSPGPDAPFVVEAIVTFAALCE